MGILLTDYLLEARDKYFNALMAMLGVIFSAVCLWQLRGAADRGAVGFSNSLLVDPFFLFFGVIFLIATALVIILSVRYLQIEDENHGEYYALMLFATVGMMFMASGYDLIVEFLGLETMALSFLRAGRVPAARQAFERRRREIPAAGRVQLGDSGLRLFDPLRDRGHGQPQLYWPVLASQNQSGRDCGRGGATGPHGPVRASGARYGGGRAFLQGGRRPVPPVGSGRVRGRSDADYGLHQRCFENGQLRPAAAPAAHRVLAGAG